MYKGRGTCGAAFRRDYNFRPPWFDGGARASVEGAGDGNRGIDCSTVGGRIDRDVVAALYRHEVVNQQVEDTVNQICELLGHYKGNPAHA